MKLNFKIIIAEDDEDDQMLMQSAFEEINHGDFIEFVSDGVALLDKLNTDSQIPNLIMMDLNMPRKNGREILAELKQNERLKYIPVIILSTSQAPFDIKSSYDAGANAYLIKPSSYEGLLKISKSIIDFWQSSSSRFDAEL